MLLWENHELYLDERKELPKREHKFPQANVRIMVRDVNKYWETIQQMNADYSDEEKIYVFAPIKDQEYGLRDFTVLDPDGFGLRFGTELNDLKNL